MKHLLFVAMLGVTAAVAQTAPPVGTEAAQPFRGANTILIHTPDSAAVAYKKLASILLDAGYTLDRADKELFFLNTKSRPAPRYNMEHVIRASVKRADSGSEISLRDAFTLPGAAAAASFMAGQQEVVYRGGQSSTFMICWNELQRVASLYPDAKLSYKQQP